MSDPMAVLHERFLARARETLSLLLRQGPAGPDVEAAVHRLAGSAGVFGFAEISRLASLVDGALHAGDIPDPQAMDRLIEALRALPPSES